MSLVNFELFIGFAIPVFVGLSINYCLFQQRNLNFSLSLALAYGLGFGLLTQWMLLLGHFYFPFRIENIGLPLITIALFFLILRLRNYSKFPITASIPANGRQSDFPPFSKNSIFFHIFCLLMFFYIAYEICFVFWRALNIPIYSWDALYFIALKAKLFFYEGSLNLLKNFPWTYPVHGESYPLHVSLSETWIALNIGQWDDQRIKILFPLTFVSYLILHYSFIKTFTNKIWAIFSVVLVISSNLLTFHATISYSDLFMMYYNCTTIILLLFWYKEKKDCYIILASLFSGFGTFVKLEGLGYSIIHGALVMAILAQNKDYLLKEKFKKLFMFAIPAVVLYSNFGYYKFSQHIPAVSRLYFDITLASWERIKIIFEQFANNLFLTGNWNILWFLLFLSLVIYVKKIKEGVIGLLSMSLAMFFGLYFCLALCSHYNFDTLVGKQSYISLSRVFLHFFPLSVWLIILLNYPKPIKS